MLYWKMDLTPFVVLQDVEVTEEERNFTIDLGPFMNPSPYVIQHVSVSYVAASLFLSS